MQVKGTSVLEVKSCLWVTPQTMLAETMSGLDIVLKLDALNATLSCSVWYPRYECQS
jgi:hypothetical protein